MERQLYRNSPDIEPAFTEGIYLEKAELNDALKIDDIGLTSAPLKSIAYQMHTHCKDYCQDFMKCRKEDGLENCLKEGRKVTRCGKEFIKEMQQTCDQVFKEHWNCLTMNNHRFEKCRPAESALNSCILKSMKIDKIIPDAPYQIHTKSNPVYK
eukprot:NODE_118_length_18285_cov_1.016606.p9 type:complete len:154 gc:universal NODE_118_length_18285_cov_1.016606:130-591(+)